MASKFGRLAERLVGAELYFIPDGENLGTTQDPEISGPDAVPVEADFDEWNLGRVNTAAYDPRTRDRIREYYRPGRGYKEQNDPVVTEDAFNFTMIDIAETLFDQIMFGLATAPVDNVAQQVFADPRRRKDGWIFLRRWREDNKVLCSAILHVRLTLQEVPTDSSEPQSPLLRCAHLADTDELEPIVFNPADDD